MNDPDQESRKRADGGASGSMKSNIAMLGFGLVTLFYLMAIGHEEWFHLRPISGVAMALSHASDGGGTAEPAREQ